MKTTVFWDVLLLAASQLSPPDRRRIPEDCILRDQ
jgi:hypothetical protein